MSLYVYNIPLGISQIGILSISVIFVVIGIGADDVLVFYDIWKQSLSELKELSEQREKISKRKQEGDSKVIDNAMSYKELTLHLIQDTFLHAGGATFVTTFTTFMAFGSSIVSPIPPFRYFGIFAALASLMNYILVILWFVASSNYK